MNLAETVTLNSYILPKTPYQKQLFDNIKKLFF